MKILLVLVISIIAAAAVSAQEVPTGKSPGLLAAEELAQRTFDAHGGEKLRDLKTLSMTGSVDITASMMNQAIPAKFAQIYSGEKYKLEVTSDFVNFMQTFDGKRTVTSPQQGVSLPPINRVGLFLLQRLGQDGFVVSEIADAKKNGFRITSPEDYYTDFYIDKKNNQIKSYNASYFAVGREVTTLVEIGKSEIVDGIVFPSKFDQKFEVSGMTVYAAFKSKEIIVNKEVTDEVFGL